jgi:hypothetical protein
MKTLFLVLGVLCFAGGAEASPCARQIAALRAQHHSPDSDEKIGESVDATLHHQPTASSVSGAGAAADSKSAEAADRDAHFEIEIDEAQAAEDSGDTAGCEAAVAKARRALAR